MNTINNADVVKEQYRNAGNLTTRISIHSKYSTNKMGFGNWIVSNYCIKPGMRILELGCGTGDMWKDHLNLLNEASEVILTDFSEGMLKTTKDTLGKLKNITYKVVDIQEIPFEDESFDIVIANMMLYHVPELEKGLSEVKRVLKHDGVFYCATYGEHGIVEYIADLLKDYGVKESVNKNFTLQNGKEKLEKYFPLVHQFDYNDALEVTQIEDIVDYVYSLSSMTNMKNVKRETITQILASEQVNGILHVPKEYGMFVCKNE